MRPLPPENARPRAAYFWGGFKLVSFYFAFFSKISLESFSFIFFSRERTGPERFFSSLFPYEFLFIFSPEIT